MVIGNEKFIVEGLEYKEVAQTIKVVVHERKAIRAEKWRLDADIE